MTKLVALNALSLTLFCGLAVPATAMNEDASKKRSVAMGASPFGIAPHAVPVTPFAHGVKAVPGAKSGKLPTAAELRAKAKGAYPRTHFDKALYFKGKGSEDAALIEFLKTTQENPRIVRAFYEQALIFRRKHFLKLAESSLEQALAIKPDYQEARILLATVRIEQGNLGGAMEELSRSLGLSGDKSNSIRTASDTRQGNGAKPGLRSVGEAFEKAPAVLQSIHSMLSELPSAFRTQPPSTEELRSQSDDSKKKESQESSQSTKRTHEEISNGDNNGLSSQSDRDGSSRKDTREGHSQSSAADKADSKERVEIKSEKRRFGGFSLRRYPQLPKKEDDSNSIEAELRKRNDPENSTAGSQSAESNQFSVSEQINSAESSTGKSKHEKKRKSKKHDQKNEEPIASAPVEGTTSEKTDLQGDQELGSQKRLRVPKSLKFLKRKNKSKEQNPDDSALSDEFSSKLGGSDGLGPDQVLATLKSGKLSNNGKDNNALSNGEQSFLRTTSNGPAIFDGDDKLSSSDEASSLSGKSSERRAEKSALSMSTVRSNSAERQSERIASENASGQNGQRSDGAGSTLRFDNSESSTNVSRSDSSNAQNEEKSVIQDDNGRRSGTSLSFVPADASEAAHDAPKAFSIPQSSISSSSLLAPLAAQPQSRAADAPAQDEWTKRLMYLEEHGTASLNQGEAFMFAEDSGEATLFLADGGTIRRKIANPRDTKEVVRERRPDILIPEDLMYNLSLLGKLMPKFDESQNQQASQRNQNQPGGQQQSMNFDFNKIMNGSDGLWGWFKHTFKF